MKTLIQSQFNYCSLTCMFHNRTLNNKINKLHESALRLVHKNDDLTFQELLDKDNSITMHDRNLQRLAVEMLTPSPMQTLFSEQSYRHDAWYMVRGEIKPFLFKFFIFYFWHFLGQKSLLFLVVKLDFESSK